MKNDYVFKIKGFDKVLTYEELMKSGVRPRCIKIIDMQQRKTWIADYRTVKEKFR